MKLPAALELREQRQVLSAISELTIWKIGEVITKKRLTEYLCKDAGILSA